jgi:hypothetical protein
MTNDQRVKGMMKDDQINAKRSEASKEPRTKNERKEDKRPWIQGQRNNGRVEIWIIQILMK